MGGRFGKYGDIKRHQVLRKSRDAKHRLEGLRLRSRVRRRGARPHPAAGAQQAKSYPNPSPTITPANRSSRRGRALPNMKTLSRRRDGPAPYTIQTAF